MTRELERPALTQRLMTRELERQALTQRLMTRELERHALAQRLIPWERDAARSRSYTMTLYSLTLSDLPPGHQKASSYSKQAI